MALPGILQAQPSAHYAPGVEGIKGASLPPPGVYFRDYNYFYWADQLNDSSGNKIGPADLEAFTYANIPRVHLDHGHEIPRRVRRRGRLAAAGLSTCERQPGV